MKKESHIPRIPHAFFRWYCKGELYEEIHGDLEEFYHDRVIDMGSTKARLYYLLDVIKCCQPYTWKKREGQLNSNFIMIKNYYKTTLRSMMKNPMSSFINIFGLAAAIGICIFTYGFAQYTYRTDQFHEHKNEVYLTTFIADKNGTVHQNGQTPRPLGAMMLEDFTHIKKICRVEDKNVVIKYGDKVFHERVRYADPEFLEMFTFPLKRGMSNTLRDVNSIILSEDMAIKYFGEEDPIGQNILVKFIGDRSKTFTITGVAEDFPASHTIDFDFLINYQNVRISEPGYDFHDWSALVNATLIQVDEATDLEPIKKKMDKYRRLHNDTKNAWTISSFEFVPLATLNQESEYIEGDISWSSKGDYTAIIFLTVVAVFMLALACFNYINIAIVSATKRLKEIGIRKSIGATRKTVIIQFLAENILITFFALIFGLVLGTTIFIPWFEEINHFDMGFKLNDLDLWVYLPAILLLTGVASGLYPAFYISKFEVVGILKGSVKFGKKNPLTKVFLAFQLVLASILITCAVMFSLNADYLTKRSWGYNPSGALYIEVPDQSAFLQLKASMIQDPNVLATAGSYHHLGKSHKSTMISDGDRQFEVDELLVDAGYFETMGLNLKEGRHFKEHYESDNQAIIINETLATNVGLEQPIGELLKIDSVRYQIIGVIHDFHNYSFDNEVHPTIFRVIEPKEIRYLSLKIRPKKEVEGYLALQDSWATLFPETPFQGGYQEDVWGGYFDRIGTHGKVWRGIALIAIILTTLGLYGLVTLNVSGRIKEFSIRKTLGAEWKNLATSIIKQYIPLFAIGLIIGAPLSYFLVEFVIEFAYTYHVPMSITGVTAAILLLVLVLILTVSTQVRKLASFNPVDGLRIE